MSKNDKNIKHQIRSEQTSKQQVKTEQTSKPEVRIEQTSKPEIRSESNLDFFAVYKQNVEKYFENMENSIPKYYQTLNELQQEYVQAWENMFKATISVQKEFAGNTGLDIEQTTIATKIISDTTEAAIKARTVRDEIILTSIDTAKENVKEWNKRSQEFIDLNRKIAQSWISSFATKQN
jgi:membrane-associated HD superfamily phosphohydrolase